MQALSTSQLSLVLITIAGRCLQRTQSSNRLNEGQLKCFDCFHKILLAQMRVSNVESKLN